MPRLLLCLTLGIAAVAAATCPPSMNQHYGDLFTRCNDLDKSAAVMLDNGRKFCGSESCIAYIKKTFKSIGACFQFPVGVEDPSVAAFAFGWCPEGTSSHPPLQSTGRPTMPTANVPWSLIPTSTPAKGSEQGSSNTDTTKTPAPSTTTVSKTEATSFAAATAAVAKVTAPTPPVVAANNEKPEIKSYAATTSSRDAAKTHTADIVDDTVKPTPSSASQDDKPTSPTPIVGSEVTRNTNSFTSILFALLGVSVVLGAFIVYRSRRLETVIISPSTWDTVSPRDPMEEL